MQKLSWSFNLALLAGVSFAAIASAEDSFAPCWRGRAGTTYQSWTFNSSSNNPATPDSHSNTNGVASASLVTGLGATGWRTSYFGQTGVWDLGQNGSISLSVPNFSAPVLPWKYVQVQVTYFDTVSFGPGAPVVSLGGGATLINTTNVTNVSTNVGAWKTQQTLWLIQPSPNSESVTIGCISPTRGLLIDQIVVDTRCPLADDGDLVANQPCWRGQPGTTFQHWMFGVSNSPTAPELKSNTYGAPSITVVPGVFSSGFLEENAFFGCRQGMWNIGTAGSLTATIPNNGAAPVGTYKYVQVQVVQYRDGIFSANAAVSVTGATQVGPPQETTMETVDAGRTWVNQRTLWKLAASPASEAVLISAALNGSLIDQVVVDTLTLNPPCPEDVLVDADAGQCSAANVVWSLPTVDGCVLANVETVYNSQSIAPPYTFPVGTNVLQTTITDVYGGTRTCDFNVVVQDVEAPSVVSALPDLIVASEVGQCGAHVNYSAAAADNCSGATVVFTPTNGSLFPLGLSTVTYQAFDGAGNTNAPASFTVRVVDYSGDVAANQPCWRGLAGSTFQHWAFAVSNVVAAPELATNAYGASVMAVAPGAFSSGHLETNAFFGCRQGMWNIGTTGSLTATIPNDGAAPVGTYKYVQVQVVQYRDGIYSANATVLVTNATQVGVAQETTLETVDIGRTWVNQKTLWKLAVSPASESVLISAAPNGSIIDQVVVDTLLQPEVVCPSDINVVTDAGICGKTNVTWPALPAVDGCVTAYAADVPTNGSTFPVGMTMVTRTIIDGGGQTNVCTFNVTVVDSLAPVPDLASLPNVTEECSASPAAPTATDNCAGMILGVPDVSFPITAQGSNVVIWTFNDGNGNLTTQTQIVVLQDVTAPVISGVAAVQSQPHVGITNVLNCASTTVQGSVAVSVTAFDSCALVTPPQVVLTNDGVGEVASFVNESPLGVFNYSWPVTASTSNGTWMATVTASDGINVASTNFTLCVYTPEVALAMLPITISNSLPVVQFTATPGHAYTLERSTDLGTNLWTSLTNIFLPLPPGGNGIGEYADPDGVVSNAFYRARFP
jgi:hypothetical protein